MQQSGINRGEDKGQKGVRGGGTVELAGLGRGGGGGKLGGTITDEGELELGETSLDTGDLEGGTSSNERLFGGIFLF